MSKGFFFIILFRIRTPRKETSRRGTEVPRKKQKPQLLLKGRWKRNLSVSNWLSRLYFVIKNVFYFLLSCLLESEQNCILDHGDSRDFASRMFCIGVTKYYVRKDTNVTFVCTFCSLLVLLYIFLYLFGRSPLLPRLIQSEAKVTERQLTSCSFFFFF